ncbi:alpha-protein kinase 3-like isoform X2 [Xyrauchen texanus]|uniref:alpha-protein kinase 3-like isoform X2 n=1 Tax=Xyrauchen texanus TaxID=154827 RepID=UPI002241BA29|nr:alpha-protein kinase 3-like isoform X2 [Xyrauchen texanus]
MTSRRPMTRSYSGNGRSGSQNGEDVSAPSGRSESRNYLANVRPENRFSNHRPSRSTLCTVMAQLTEETQPCFETTIKSKAVSETCNVKFSCVVTGNPAPELTWYKDDMELDRYCGLPKYEIFRNEKIHTLHIYNCTEEDAAIYQASARNSKGIVSCSGVLEVGTMSEFLIHQRFFAKLKQKAEKKRRELEESRRRGKENIQKEQLNVINQERLLRKHRSPAGTDPLSSSPATQDGEGNVTSQATDTIEQPAVIDDKSYNMTIQASVSNTDATTENGNDQLNHVCNKIEVVPTKQSTKEKIGEKKTHISNGFDETGIILPKQSNREEEDDNEEISLAKYLAMSVQSQAAEQHQSSVQSQDITDVDVSVVQEKEGEEKLEKERERLKEEESKRTREVEKDKDREQAQEKERDKSRQIKPEQKVAFESATKAATNKEPEHQHKSAITSVFHSLKDIFFGKSKKSTEKAEDTRRTSDMIEGKELPQEKYLPPAEIPLQEPERKNLVYGVVSEQDTLKLVQESSQTVDLELKRKSLQQTQDSAAPNETVKSNSVEYISEVNTIKPEDVSATLERHNEGIEGTLEMPKRVVEESSPEEVPQISHSLLFKSTDDHTKPSGNEVPGILDLANQPSETEGIEFTFPVDEVMQGAEEMHILEVQGVSASSLTDLSKADLESMQCCESQSESHLSQLADYIPITVHAESQSSQLRVDESKECCDSHSNEKEISHINEASIMKTQEGGSQTEEIKERMDGATEGEYFAPRENEVESDFVMNESDLPVVVVLSSTKDDTIDENALSPALGQNREGDSISCLSENAVEIDIKSDEKSIPAQDVSFPENVEVVADSAPVNDYNMKENKNDNSISSQDRCAEENGEDSVEEQIDKSSEKERNGASKEKGHLSTEDKRDDSNEKKKDDDKRNKNVVPVPDVSTVIPEKEISKNARLRAETEVMETQPRPYKTDKSKILTKAQVERLLTEKDQQAIQPIIILPDTRETVIKNVAKKRVMPLIPEIKVTVPERVKREEPVSTIPKVDVLKLEPERVMQPLTQEVAHLFREHDSPMDEATRLSGESNRALVIPEQLGVTRNIQSAPSEDRSQEVKPQNLETTVRVGEGQRSIGNGLGREDDNSIPIISIACADDNATTLEQKHTFGQSSLPGILISQDSTKPPTIPPISITDTDKWADSSFKKKEDFETSVAMLKRDSDHVAMSSGKSKEQLMSQLSPDVPLSLSTKNPQSITTQDTDSLPLSKDTRVETEALSDRLQRDKLSIEKLSLTTPVGPMLPPLSPASLRRLIAKNNPNLENQGTISGASVDGSEKKGEESGGSTPTSTLSCESSPKMKRRDSLTLIPSATPEELASGARRKIYLAKTKSEDEGSDTQGKRDSPYMSPSQARRAAFLQLQSGQQTPPTERRSPLMARRKTTLEVPKPKEESTEVADSAKTETKPAEKEKLDPFKAPQVIRKIRGESFSDASGHLKLWCQFFNILSDSTIKWYRDEDEIVEMERRAGDESPVALAIVQASSRDCGVYGCSIKNEYGTDITDYLLSADILAEFFLRDDLDVGEEIELTPMMFTKGLADSGYWGDKFFGRIMTEEVQIGEGCVHKTCRAKVIYGLNPVFESGTTCITKVRNPIAYGAKEESNLAERNLEITKQECKTQNTVREYCKIFAAEARVIENFGFSLEVIPLHLMYRPANTVPYAAVETDLNGVYVKYCLMDSTGRLITRSATEVEQKCCTFQHWIHQWTNGNLLVTRLEGVDTKITSIEIVTKSKGYQGLTDKGSPNVMEQFITQHQCNYYCGLLGLRPLKPMDSLQQQKIKTSRSPLLARRGVTGSSSPQLQKKGTSPQSTRKGTSSPKVVKKTDEAGVNKPAAKHKAVEVPKPVKLR